MPATGMDYYDVLGLQRDATDVDAKRAYRRLALKFHPDRNTAEAARGEFIRVCEAYDVISNVELRGVYDLYGEEALKSGTKPDAATGEPKPLYSFDAESGPAAVFARFFGTANPFEALNSISAQFTMITKHEKLKLGKPKVYPLELTLEEIHHGVIKTVTHARKTLLEDGSVTEEQRTLTIDVKPGMPDGTTFVFEGEGHVTPQNAPGAVVFVLKHKKHALYDRKGAHDLKHEATIPLYQALVGTTLRLKALDGRTLSVPINGVVTPGKKFTLKGEGLPDAHHAGRRGDLVVKVELLFPAEVHDNAKQLMKAAFFLPQKLSKAQADALHKFEVAFTDAKDGWSSALKKN